MRNQRSRTVFSFEEFARKYLRELDEASENQDLPFLDLSQYSRLYMWHIVRLLLFCEYLRQYKKKTPKLIFPKSETFCWLSAELGLLNVLNTIGLEAESLPAVETKRSKRLRPTVMPMIVFQDRVKQAKTGRLTEVVQAAVRREFAVLAELTPLCGTPDFCKAVRFLVAELLENIKQHSEISKNNGFGLVTAIYFPSHTMAIPRQSSTAGLRHTDVVARTKFLREWGALGHFELIIADSGTGLLKSLEKHLGMAARSTSRNKWEISHEQNVISSVFDKNVLVRKGRQSTGLYLVRNVVALHGGTIEVRTGRCEMHLVSDRKGHIACDFDQRELAPLPGVAYLIRIHCDHARVGNLVEKAAQTRPRPDKGLLFNSQNEE